MEAPFTIYRSSAGSGKTRTLAKAYLKLALQYQSGYFRHILAVTFTNKATQEMKDRILEYLDDFAKRRPNELAEELKKELGLDDSTFRERSRDTQNAILHKYSQFSISTIDAFFQRVIRSFTRESGLVGDYRLEVETDAVLQEVVDALIDELGGNKELTDWVVEFARVNLENERAWDVRSSLIEFSKEIFTEEFKNIEDEVTDATRAKGFFRDLLRELRTMKYTFVNFVRGKAEEALAILHENGLSRSDFKYGHGGAYGFLEKLTKISSVGNFSDKEKGSMPDNQYQDSVNWPAKTTPHFALLRQLAGTKLIPILNQILEYRRKNYQACLSAEVVLANFYTFGLIADISRKLREYKDENNMMLLDDAPKFLNRVLGETDTPFIYEKVGSFYRNYLIDEFQDTSGLQWKNFLPLVTNSLSQGYANLVVGDVKQAIYRWRGGNLNLLQRQVVEHIGEQWVTIRQLNSNYRSSTNVVSFNNAFFKAASSLISLDTGQPVPLEVYGDVAQQVSRKEEGFVHVAFLKDDLPDETWKEKSLKMIPKYLERLQDEGMALSDIAILVRKNDEGQEIVSELMRYSHSEEARTDCRYDVVSNESLRLDGASSVNLLVAAMRYLLNTQDAIALAQLAYEYSRTGGGRIMTDVFGVANQGFFEEGLPRAFTSEKAALKKLPLFELTESLVRIFGLGKDEGEIAYLQAFQDIVLEFSARERNDLGMFLEWWELNRHKKSVQISGGVDAVQILTIHKAKGLQFKVVLIPFCSWNLDHEGFLAPTLWVKSDHPPFDRAGHLPVKYSSTLEETFYSADYQEEKLRVYLDNLNLLYVALTRAEHGLIVMSPNPDVKWFKQYVSRILFEGIVSGEGLGEGWDNAAQVWRKGDWRSPAVERREREAKTDTLRQYMAFDWRDKLVVKRSAKEFFSDPKDDTRTRINYGIHMHAILSGIMYAPEMDDALTRMVQEGMITSAERPVLQGLLDDLLGDKQIRSWFSPGWEVRTEVPVLLPGGGESRMDRLLVKEKHAIVIDFKTGVPSASDQRQMQEYMTILTQMNFYPVEGFLLYTRSGEVVTVKTGKPRRVPKKDAGQLELGL